MSQPLPTTVLGRTGLEVTRLGFGAAFNRPMSEGHAKALLNAVVDSGINVIDTAYDYVNSESSIGEFLSHRYSEFHLATKCGCTESDGIRNTSDHIWTRENLFRGLDGSLQRLKRDSVDIMQLHNPTVEESESGGLIDALEEMRKQGRVRWIGVSTTLPHLPTFLKWGVFDVFQIPYSALERDHEDWITKVGSAGIGVIIRGGVASGEPGMGLGDADRWHSFEQAGLDGLRGEGESRSAFVLRFTLTHPHTHTIIVGTTNVDHLRENVRAALRGPLPDDVYTEAKRRLDAVGQKPAAVD